MSIQITTGIINLIVALLTLAFVGWFIKRAIVDHFEDKRRERGLDLVVEIRHLMIDEKIDEKEALHLVNTLTRPSAAAITMVEERLDEIRGLLPAEASQ
jgi:hypothetical protein